MDKEKLKEQERLRIEKELADKAAKEVKHFFCIHLLCVIFKVLDLEIL